MAGIKQPNLEDLRPYGDTLDDGKVQLSFALPVPTGPEASEAARRLVLNMGMVDPLVVAMEAMGPAHSFFVLYAAVTKGIDYAHLEVPKAEFERLEMAEIDDLVARKIGRKLVVVGACPGTDAHTVGIDAIMNMKGYDGHYGLERYKMFRAINMGAQVAPDALVARAIAEGADAILASVVVTQKDLHITTLTHLVEVLEAEGVRSRLIVVAGGPRMTHDLATELGFDAGFGPGSYAEDVAAYLAQEWLRRHG
ncbi:MAG: cobalamin-dependent protein [Candidatus Sericytochromatia bacterium]|nr:cobalamin-dependent protein [Candidatus Tanganyikabacteria bacterium]